MNGNFQVEWNTNDRMVNYTFNSYEAMLDIDKSDFYAWKKSDKKIIRQEHNVSLKDLNVFITQIDEIDR